jgi:hypothetical protein
MNSEIQEIIDLAAGQGIVLDPCLLRDYPIGTWFWAVHHMVVCEPLTEPLVNRIRYILTSKDLSERSIRLMALRPVMAPDNLPEPLVKARAEYDKAWVEYGKARVEYGKVCAEYNKAWAEYNKAGAEYNKELFTQWGEEYPDHPIWDENGLAF